MESDRIFQIITPFCDTSVNMVALDFMKIIMKTIRELQENFLH